MSGRKIAGQPLAWLATSWLASAPRLVPPTATRPLPTWRQPAAVVPGRLEPHQPHPEPGKLGRLLLDGGKRFELDAKAVAIDHAGRIGDAGRLEDVSPGEVAHRRQRAREPQPV